VSLGKAVLACEQAVTVHLMCRANHVASRCSYIVRPITQQKRELVTVDCHHNITKDEGKACGEG